MTLQIESGFVKSLERLPTSGQFPKKWLLPFRELVNFDNCLYQFLDTVECGLRSRIWRTQIDLAGAYTRGLEADDARFMAGAIAARLARFATLSHRGATNTIAHPVAGSKRRLECDSDRRSRHRSAKTAPLVEQLRQRRRQRRRHACLALQASRHRACSVTAKHSSATPSSFSFLNKVEGATGFGQCALAPASDNCRSMSPEDFAVSTITTVSACSLVERRSRSTSIPLRPGKPRSNRTAEYLRLSSICIAASPS